MVKLDYSVLIKLWILWVISVYGSFVNTVWCEMQVGLYVPQHEMCMHIPDVLSDLHLEADCSQSSLMWE